MAYYSAHSKIPKLFTMRVKTSFDPIILRKIGDGFVFFLKQFLRWFSDVSNVVGDFKVKMSNFEWEIGNNWESLID